MLTPRQTRAMTHAHHVCVTANAGSGKTRVLVERYLDLVLHGHAGAQEIVALTFTEKAAGELKKKIADRVAEELRLSDDPARSARLERLRSDLSGANIGTIHSFCGRLLREHPVEARVDAAFGVIEGLDQRVLLQDALRESLTSILRGQGEDELRDRLGDVVRLLGKRKLRHMISTLIEKREQFDRWTSDEGIYNRGEEEILAMWDDCIAEFVGKEIRSRNMQDGLQRILGHGAGSRSSTAVAHYQLFNESRDLTKKAGALIALLDVMMTKSGDVSKLFAKIVPEEFIRDVQFLGRWRTSLRPLLEEVVDACHRASHKRLLSITRTLLSAAQLTLERYTRSKLESGQLDFEDLQLLARDLVRREEVVRHLSRRFHYILVDEYQDTNQLQYDIILPLLNDLQQGNLFIVGDPKQSIYGFRNANVAVFERTKQDLIRHAGARADVVLEESFRPLRSIVAFVNLLFSRVLGSAGPGGLKDYIHERGYEQLCQARENDSPGRVEILLPGAGEGEVLTEGELVGCRLLRLHRDGYEVFSHDESGHPFRFQDAAVLLRSRLPLQELEDAFMKLGVPYVVTGGVGYFQTQDIVDFYNYFTFLLNPHSDVALAGILRSPFFGVSDAELFEAAESKGDTSLWSHLQSEMRQKPLLRALKDAVTVLRADQAVALTLTVPELIDYIVRRTLYTSKIAGTTRVEQALANLTKLRVMAANYESHGFTNLYDFTQRLKQLIEEEREEGQGVVEGRRDAVQIMTIHAAKGLEFPVVFLPYLHRSFRDDHEPFLDDRLGIGFTYRNIEDEKNEEVPITILLKEVSRQKTLSEEKRVFYVGATRARDVLVLSGDPLLRGASPSRLGWLMDALEMQRNVPQAALELSTSVTVLKREGERFVTGEVEYSFRVPILRPDDLQYDTHQETVPATIADVPSLMIRPVSPHPTKEIFSATKIRTYRECPTRYYLRYILGLPEYQVAAERFDDEEISESGLHGEAVGRVFHSVMQRIDRLAGDQDALAAEVLSSLQLEGFAAMENPSPTVGRVVSLVERTVSAPIWNDIKSGSGVKTEFTISAPLDDDYIMGTIDRLYRDAEGVWSVLDYKTDAVGEGELHERAAAYLPQVQFYALLASRYFSASPIRAALFFTSHPETPVQHQFTRRALEDFEQEVSLTIGDIKNGRFPAPEQQCRSCPFRPGPCPSISR